MKRSILFLNLWATFTALLISSCQSQVKLEGFDDKAWKADYNACDNRRGELGKQLIEKKDALKKFDDDAITELLGAPERNRQFARGEKSYIYFLYPGKQCEGDTTGKEGKKLVIEFDALGKPRIIRESFIDY
ncbi:MAG TPA: hypothetical protein VNB90_03060 [Cytophagaceae bacterium]|nr:hypothetical protein [Cytophagaceae bacterium]